jgi:hypothetical protein
MSNLRPRSPTNPMHGVNYQSPLHPDLADATVVHRIEGIPSCKLEQALWQKRKERQNVIADSWMSG